VTCLFCGNCGFSTYKSGNFLPCLQSIYNDYVLVYQGHWKIILKLDARMLGITFFLNNSFLKKHQFWTNIAILSIFWIIFPIIYNYWHQVLILIARYSVSMILMNLKTILMILKQCCHKLLINLILYLKEHGLESQQMWCQEKLHNCFK